MKIINKHTHKQSTLLPSPKSLQLIRKFKFQRTLIKLIKKGIAEKQFIINFDAKSYLRKKR